MTKIAVGGNNSREEADGELCLVLGLEYTILKSELEYHQATDLVA